MNKIEEYTKPRFITALTSDHVDWSLFQKSNAKEHLESWFPSQNDFRREAVDVVSRTYGQENAKSPLIIRSSALETFLQENRPPTLFFSPDDIKNLLTPESSIICNHEETPTLKIWEFTLNPQRYEASTNTNQQPTITLIRRKSGAHDLEEPYLVVGSAAGYDGSNVTFDPKIKTTYGDSRPREILEVEMIKLLGLQQHTVKQRLIFKTKEQKVQILYEAPLGRLPDSLEQSIEDKKLKVYFVGISLAEENYAPPPRPQSFKESGLLATDTEDTDLTLEGSEMPNSDDLSPNPGLNSEGEF